MSKNQSLNIFSQLKGTLWLEFKKSWVAIIALLGIPVMSIPLFHMLKNKLVNDPLTPKGIGSTTLIFKNALLHVPGLAFISFIGIVILLFIASKMRNEMRSGQLRLLKMTPASGYIHILGRFLFLALLGTVFFSEIFSYGMWELLSSLKEVHAELENPLRMGIVHYFNLLLALIFPAISWILLTVVTMSAYQLRGSPSLVGLFLCFSSVPFFFRYINFLISKSGLLMNKIHLSRLMYQGQDLLSDAEGVPIEPAIGMLILTFVFLALSGRIWEEMEL